MATIETLPKVDVYIGGSMGGWVDGCGWMDELKSVRRNIKID